MCKQLRREERHLRWGKHTGILENEPATWGKRTQKNWMNSNSDAPNESWRKHDPYRTTRTKKSNECRYSKTLNTVPGAHKTSRGTWSLQGLTDPTLRTPRSFFKNGNKNVVLTQQKIVLKKFNKMSKNRSSGALDPRNLDLYFFCGTKRTRT